MFFWESIWRILANRELGLLVGLLDDMRALEALVRGGHSFGLAAAGSVALRVCPGVRVELDLGGVKARLLSERKRASRRA